MCLQSVGAFFMEVTACLLHNELATYFKQRGETAGGAEAKASVKSA